MITVKGTRSNSDATAPTDAYAEAEPARRSRVPYMMGAFLSAVVLYFRTAMAGNAAPDTAPEAASSPQGTQKEALAEAGTEVVAPPPSRGEVHDRTTTLRPSTSADQSEALILRSAPVAAFQIDMSNGFSLPVAANTGRPSFHFPTGPDALDGFSVNNAMTQGPDQSSSSPSVGESLAAPVRRNAPPAAVRPPYVLDVGSGVITVIALSDLLAQVADPEGNALSIVEASVSSGILVPTETGFQYRSAPEFVGEVVLSFTVTDGYSLVKQTARLTVEPNIAEGTANADQITGTGFVEDIRGQAGDDDIAADDGADIVHGGAGDDRISGGAGHDRIFGEDGNDMISGGAGNDWIFGGEGQDRISGGDGDDFIGGDAGADLISDGAGADTVDGGQGDDIVIAASDGVSDSFDGGEGLDTIDYSSAGTTVFIDLVEGVAEGLGIGEDEILSFEIVIAGSDDDHIVAGVEGLIITGGDGDDVFEFAGGPPSEGVVRTVHEILDFAVGDRIIARGLELFHQRDDDAGDRAQLLEHDPMSAGQIPYLRLSYERPEEDERTVIEWDSENIGDFMTVVLYGHQVLVFSLPA